MTSNYGSGNAGDPILHRSEGILLDKSAVVAFSSYKEKVREIEKLSLEVERLASSDAIRQAEIVKDKFEALMDAYDATASDVARVICFLYGLDLNKELGAVRPKGSVRAPSTQRTKPRKLVTYQNPHTGEVVVTRGGNHRILNQWREEYGEDAVKSWVQK